MPNKTLIRICMVVFVALLAIGYISTTDWFKPKLKNRPLVIAHRAGSGQWPQNSRTAVLNSIATTQAEDPAKRYQGIELDIVLTKDDQLVLSHDPWIHATLCQTASGEVLKERILIRHLTLADLQSQFLCGGVSDNDFPQVVPKAESIMTLDEVLEALTGSPEMVLYLDIKIDGELTARAEAYANALARSLERSQLTNRIYIEGPSMESLMAYRTAIKDSFVSVLSYPPFSAEENLYLTAISSRWLTKIGIHSPLKIAREAVADAIAAPTQVITWNAANNSRKNGVAVVLFTPNSKEDFARYCSWPADILITDFPNLGHCP